MNDAKRLRLAVVGAGPVGLALALHAARLLPQASLTVYDARTADADIGADARVLALSLGSLQFLRRLGCEPQREAASIDEVMISQAPPSPGAPEVWMRAGELGVPRLGAVVHYGALLERLQRAWLEEVQAAAPRLAMRFAARVRGARTEHATARFEVSAAGASGLGDGEPPQAVAGEPHDLVVVAEGGLFADQARKALMREYRQVAWVGTATLSGATPGLAIERFTRQGPLALLPLPAVQPAEAGLQQAALVWCVDAAEDPVAALDEAQRIALINTLLPAVAGRVLRLTALKAFKLGLNAERTLASGRVVRIGNAAQTLHPVAGQGLNLGLRDAHTLVAALRDAESVGAALARVEWARAPDRWSVIALTDLLARGFTWQWPGAGSTRAAALALLQHVPALRRGLARGLMYGLR